MQVEALDYSTYVPSSVAMSSAESETNAGANAFIAMQHIRTLRNELNGLEVDLLIDPPILTLCDNSSSVTIANTDKDVKSIRHCTQRLLYIRQLRREKKLLYSYINNQCMVADIGTKNLYSSSLQPLIKMIMCKINE